MREIIWNLASSSRGLAEGSLFDLDAEALQKDEQDSFSACMHMGCGSRPVGDVICNRFLGKSSHTRYIIKKCRDFVICDAEHLPFRCNIFSVVHASNVMEHLYHPFNFLKEARRVSRMHAISWNLTAICKR
jgi:hypothetical protein